MYEGSLSYNIMGGLQPGREDRWRLVPNLTSDLWRLRNVVGSLFPSTGFRLDISVASVTFHEGGTIRVSVFTDRDAKELENARERLQELNP